ncbi:MAG: hypothetical protein ACRDK1_07040 [Solirubrobacterales bacterium]
MRSTPQQALRRDRIEALIGLVAPALDLLLNVGERGSRLIAPADRDYYPIRPPEEAFELRGARAGTKREQVD